METKKTSVRVAAITLRKENGSGSLYPAILLFLFLLAGHAADVAALPALTEPYSKTSASSSVASSRKLTGRNPSLHAINAVFFSFIHPL